MIYSKDEYIVSSQDESINIGYQPNCQIYIVNVSGMTSGAITFYGDNDSVIGSISMADYIKKTTITQDGSYIVLFAGNTDRIVSCSGVNVGMIVTVTSEV